LTYVECENLRFGALGHPITDYETGAIIPAKSGKIFTCSVVGLNKGEKGSPGEIKGVFMQGQNSKGTVDNNTQFGVFGTITEKEKIIDTNKVADVGSRLTMKPGKATLISSISGVSEEYEIEIIKANYQPSSSDKSFVFRVTDARLLELTGGIIQGMSGSPILQNGKIVGAVTHVFVSDPTKGYGVYVDWMIAS
jgi:stage IV sporulation protein B